MLFNVFNRTYYYYLYLIQNNRWSYVAAFCERLKFVKMDGLYQNKKELYLNILNQVYMQNFVLLHAESVTSGYNMRYYIHAASCKCWNKKQCRNKSINDQSISKASFPLPFKKKKVKRKFCSYFILHFYIKIWFPKFVKEIYTIWDIIY